MTLAEDRTSDELLISSDSHVKLEHDVVKRHLATKFHDAYDKAAADYQARMSQGTSAVNQAWQTKRQWERDTNAFRFRFVGQPGHVDPVARLEAMDLDGVEQEVLFCEVSAFRYLYQVEGATAEATTAFNDAMHEFASADPNRLIASYQIPIHDIDLAVKEVERIASLGGKSLQLPLFPPELGLPDYYHERYDPLFATIQETGLPICCHIGLNTSLEGLNQRDPTPDRGITGTMTALSTGEALGMWVLTGIFERFPDLKVVMVEPGLGWVAWWVYIIDDIAIRQGCKFPDLAEKPSFYFHRNMFLTFIDEPDALESDVIRHRLGVENIMWSSDYPHPVTSWPNSRKIVNEQFADLPEHERRLIVSGNAQRVWNL